MKYTNTDIPIDFKKKQSYKSFTKTVWQLTNTNLHYIDFCEIHKAKLEAIYKPVKIEGFKTASKDAQKKIVRHAVTELAEKFKIPKS